MGGHDLGERGRPLGGGLEAERLKIKAEAIFHREACAHGVLAQVAVVHALVETKEVPFVADDAGDEQELRTRRCCSNVPNQADSAVAGEALAASGVETARRVEAPRRGLWRVRVCGGGSWRGHAGTLRQAASKLARNVWQSLRMQHACNTLKIAARFQEFARRKRIVNPLHYV